MSAVRVAGVVAGYGRVPVLDHVDLDLGEGSLTAVLGASGCGKSTLLRAVAGLLPISAGTVEVGGQLVAGRGVHVPAERRNVGLVPQDAALFPHRDVAANIGFGLRRRQGRSQRVAELVSLVGLDGLERRMPYELSGGQRHRVALARALAPRPTVLLLDEPFAALDAGLRAELRVQVRDVLRAARTTALLVTHDQTEALSMADQVAVMADGRIEQAGAPAEVYRSPVSPAVAGFVGDALLLPGRWRDGRIRCVLGDVSPAGGVVGEDGDDVAVLVRPEQIRLLAPGDAADEDQVLAVVRAVDFYGHDADIELDLIGEPALARRLRARVTSDHLPARGSRVRIGVVGPAVTFPSLGDDAGFGPGAAIA